MFGLAACASGALAQQLPAGSAPSGPAVNQAPSGGSQQQPGAAGKPAEATAGAAAGGGASSGVPADQAQTGGAPQQTGAPADAKPPIPAEGVAQDGAPAPVVPDVSAQATIRDVVVTGNEPPPPPPPAPVAPPPESPLQELAKPGTDVSGAVLTKEHETTVQDFTQAVPSVSVTQPNARNVRIFIRGIGKTSTVEALENSVGFVLDGVVLTNDAMAWGEFPDVQRLDVLRGPQGFTCCKNTTLGTLSITSLPPSFTPENDISLTYGNRNLFFVTGSSTGTLVDNILAYRASVYAKYQEGFIDSQYPNLGIEPWNGINRWGGRLQFLYTPNSNVATRVILDHSESQENPLVSDTVKDPQTWTDTGGPRPITYSSRLARFGYSPIFNPFESAGNVQQQTVKSTNTGVSSQTDWKIDGGYTLTSISGYRSYYFNALNDNDYTYLAINQGGYKTWGQQVSEELRLTSPKEQEFLGQKFDYVAGLFVLHDEYNADLRYLYGADSGKFYANNAQYAATSAKALVNSLNGIQSFQIENPELTSLAGYGQTTWHATDRWDLTLGFRNTFEDKTSWTQKYYVGGVNLASLYSGADLVNATAVRNTTLALFTSGTNRINGQPIDTDMWQWQVNPSYKFTKDILGYFSASYGEKSGAVQFNPLTGLPDNVLPEQVMDYELGLRTSWFNNTLVLNPNLYWTDIINYQAALAEILPGQVTYTSVLGNIPGIRNRGAEIDGTYITPIEGLKFTFSGSYADATYTDFTNSPCSADLSYSATKTCNLTGQPFSGVSRWVGTIGADYSRPVWDGYIGYFFVNETFRSRANLSTTLSIYGWQSDYSITNAGIGIHPVDNNWDLSFWGKNIFDTHYYTALTTVSPAAPVTGVIGDPLVFGVTFRKKF